MLHIDGRQGEGGGQVLRTSLSLSALTGRPFWIDNIRANRSRPGLRPQHLTAVRAVADICQAELAGDAIYSTSLAFRPTVPPREGEYTFDVTEASPSGRSAGAVTLILQAVLWPLLFAPGPSKVVLRGGTFVPFSPPYHYLQEVARPAFARFGVEMSARLMAWGWMSAGRGEVEASVAPLEQLESAAFEPQTMETVGGLAAVTNLPSHIPHRMARRAHNLLQAAGLNSQVQPLRERGHEPGAGIVIWAPQAGFSSLGRKGLPADKVAEAAIAELLAFKDNGAAVDRHLADQLLLPMALAKGRSSFTTNQLTRHTLTNVQLLRQWLDLTIEVDGQLEQPGRITGERDRLSPQLTIHTSDPIMFEVIFLGTSASTPSAYRGLSAHLILHRQYRFLIDCGEGTQQQILRSGMGFKRLDKVLLTHGHLDHILGLGGLASTLGRWEMLERLEIYGGRATLGRVAKLIFGVVFPEKHPPSNIELIPLSPGDIILEDDKFRLQAFPVYHRGPDCFGYLFEEKARRPFLADKAEQLGVPFGPERAELVRGRPVTLADGRTIEPGEVLGETIPGTKFVHIGDVGRTDNLVEVCRGADALIIESTYLESEAVMARQFGHLTAAQAARLAIEAGVKTLILTHLSRRYFERDVIKEARVVFPNSYVARDFDHFQISRDGTVRLENRRRDKWRAEDEQE